MLWQLSPDIFDKCRHETIRKNISKSALTTYGRLGPFRPSGLYSYPGGPGQYNPSHRFNTSGTYITEEDVLFAADAEKAFDRVAWDFIRATLSYIGLGPQMLQFILALYTVPTAAVRVNEWRSSYFPISNGTRQGCPLSPLIFVLCLEPLLCRIRSSPDIAGIQSGGEQHKVAAFADDLLFFATNPSLSLPNILDALKTYSGFSNYKINVTKSAALNISLSDQEERALRTAFPFQWASDTLKYLGIQLTADPADLYRKNYLPLVGKIKADLRIWQLLAVTWFGRCSVIKMNVLPRILYLMQTIPIAVPKEFFQSIKGILRAYIWANKSPRIKMQTLALPKVRGGMGLPDILRYYRAVHIVRVVDWHCNKLTKRWVDLENEETGQLTPPAPWSVFESKDAILKHPTVGATIKETKRIQSHWRVAPGISPMTPILGNPDFPPGCINARLRRWAQNGKRRLGDIWQNGPMPSLEELRTGAGESLDYFSLYQLYNYIRSVRQKGYAPRELTDLENMCRTGNATGHLISRFYTQLSEDEGDQQLPFIQKWEQELNTVWSKEQINKILRQVHQSSLDSKIQETGYKILTRWYRVPSLLHRIKEAVSGKCWRCGLEDGNMVHIFWGCKRVRPFWNKIAVAIKHIANVDILEDPALCLLHLTGSSVRSYRKSLTLRLLNAARACIPIFWKQTVIPTYELWCGKVNEIFKMEELSAILGNSEDQVKLRWRPWVQYLEANSS